MLILIHLYLTFINFVKILFKLNYNTDKKMNTFLKESLPKLWGLISRTVLGKSNDVYSTVTDLARFLG
jgi:hypothetical protein